MLYGIAASNPDAKNVRRMQNMMTKNVRAITKSFGHMQHEPTRNLFERCLLPTIVESLLREAQALHTGLSRLVETTTFTTEHQVEDARAIAAGQFNNCGRQSASVPVVRCAGRSPKGKVCRSVVKSASSRMSQTSLTALLSVAGHNH